MKRSAVILRFPDGKTIHRRADRPHPDTESDRLRGAIAYYLLGGMTFEEFRMEIKAIYPRSPKRDGRLGPQ